jgi:hypothetical protein
MPRVTRGGKKPGRTGGVRLNFAGVEASAGIRVIDEGPVLLAFDSFEEKEAQSSGEPMLTFKWKVAEGPFQGTPVWDNFAQIYVEGSVGLSRLKGVLDALGVDATDELELDNDMLEGMVIGADISNEEYQGKMRNRIGGYYPAADLQPEPEKKKPAAAVVKASASRKKVAEPEPDPEPGFTKGDAVSFMEGKKKLVGKVVSVDEGENTVIVAVGRDEYEVDLEDVTAE